jgi:FkbM family methyltransferase
MKILFDIGANRGLYSDANAKDYESIVLVEANPSLCSFLSSKYQQNPLIHIENVIVSNKSSETFYISNADTISTVDPEWIHQSRFSKNYSWRPVDGLPTVSLDALVQKYGKPAHIKIDVEGYEYNVIQSLTTKVDSLCFEWAEEKKKEILLTLEYLKNLGFTRFAIQMEDAYVYTVQPHEWMSYQDIWNLMSMNCDEERKDKWGMVWVS